MSDKTIEIFNDEYTPENPDCYMTDFHYHDIYEIYYLFSGKVNYLINHSIYDVNEGDIILIKKQDLHMTKPTVKIGENIKIHINDKALNSLGENSEEFIKCFDTSHIVLSQKDKHYVNSLFLKILAENNNSSQFSNQLIKNYIYELLSFLYDIIHSDSYHISSDITSSAVNKAIRYIYKNYNENLTLDDIAELCHMNSSYFSRYFKQNVGINLNAYINTVRLKEATVLLINTELPIIDIAHDCGYNDHKYFCEIFKKHTGYSPGKFRKNNKIKQGISVQSN